MEHFYYRSDVECSFHYATSRISSLCVQIQEDTTLQNCARTNLLQTCKQFEQSYWRGLFVIEGLQGIPPAVGMTGGHKGMVLSLSA